MTRTERHARRAEAAARVRGLHPPLPVLFAALRAEAGVAPDPAPDPVPEPAPDPVPDPAPPAEPVPDPAPRPPADPLLATLAGVVADRSVTDADELALRFAVAAEDVVVALARAGVRAARDAGAEDAGDVDGTAVDVVMAAMRSYVTDVAAAHAAGAPAPEPPGDLLPRLRGVARSAGVVAALRPTRWVPLQRFGQPWCPRPGCYGRDGAHLDDAWVAEHGLPPYGDGCNCSAEPFPPPD